MTVSRKLRRCQRCRRRLGKHLFVWTRLARNPYHKANKCNFCVRCQCELSEEYGREYKPYANRDIVLRALGFATYAAYLASATWHDVRARVLKRDVYICRSCGARATQVHHNVYGHKELSGQSLKGMRSLCAACHRLVEFDGDRKVGATEASERCRVLTDPHSGL